MKSKIQFLLITLALLSAVNLHLSTARAQGTTFAYEGRLNVGGYPANGSYDLTFALFDATTSGAQTGGTLTNSLVGVTNGLFNVALDFGMVFTGADRFLEISVRTNGAGAFALLSPRQKLLPTPYAIFAGRAGVSASYAGPITLSQIPTGVALLNNNQTFTGTASFSSSSNTFTGSGAGLTGVHFNQLNGDGLISTGEPAFGPFSPAFTNFVGVFPWSLVAADFNGDGKPDIAVVNNYPDNTVVVLTNNGSGGLVFASTNAVGSSPSQVVAADVNGDSKLDLIIANKDTIMLDVLTNNGSGVFALSTSPAGQYFVAAADVNGDGKVDLISEIRGGVGLKVSTNNGSGNFVLAWTNTIVPESVATADVNGDGKVDLICAASGALQILTNNGSGIFALASSAAVGPGTVAPVFVVSADVNGDGRIDLISANRPVPFPPLPPFVCTISVLTNSGNGSFVLSTTLSGDFEFAYDSAPLLVAADINGDGKADIVAANGYTNTLSVLLNNGAGNFILASSPVTGPVGWIGPTSVAVADINGDGRPDLIAANPSEYSLAILNNSSSIAFEAPVSVHGSLDVGGVSTFTNPANIFAGDFTGSFTGNGTGLTSLNAASIASGTLADGRLSTNVALRAGGNSFTGDQRIGGHVGINTAAPQEPLHLTITPGDGIGLRIDAAAIGHTPAIYLNHTGTGGRNFRIASYGNNFSLGSFVIRDDTAGADRLTIAAGGNIGIGTATPGSSLEVAGGIHARGGAPGAAGVNDNGYAFSGNGGDNDSGMFSSADGQVEFYANSTEIMRLRPDRVGIATTTISTLFQVGSATCNGTTWANASDRNLKENFRSVDAQELLAKVAALPLTEWNYKQDAAARHVGPVAQDFKAVFGLGTDDKTICTVDEGGVALAAIQGLNQKLEETRAENAVLKARLERLEKLLADSIHKGISKSLKP